MSVSGLQAEAAEDREPPANLAACTEATKPPPERNAAMKKTAAKGQSSASTAGTKKRAVPKGTKKDPSRNSEAPQKPDPAKTKYRCKRKPSTSDDSDSTFEKVFSRGATSKKSKAESDDVQMALDSSVAPQAKSMHAKKSIKSLQ
ncbi:DNA topoisomerase 2-alpha [Fukomys damarensis]|uniref:DNA topoisomerase 2-alpha n=1 Tax=Fukomys damarensis TaxID=885580 RepID=A0A091DFV9_FUKDA|nr:DNA topoisomerase 2-alpha [Fukomys damarensis]